MRAFSLGRPDAGLTSLDSDPIAIAHRATQEYRRRLDEISRCGKRGGPVPDQGLLAASFRDGYRGTAKIPKAERGTLHHHAWLAGRSRAKAEPNLTLPGEPA